MRTKGKKQTARQKLVHQTFRDTIVTGKTMKVYKYKIVSKGHTNMTVKQIKIALSPFDSKRFRRNFDSSNWLQNANEIALLEDIYMDIDYNNSCNEADNGSLKFKLPNLNFL